MAKKVYRSRSDCKVAGVCGGLAEYFNIDTILLRLALVLMALYGGAGLILYLVAWLMIPPNPDEDGSEPFERSERARKKVISTVQGVGEKLEETWKTGRKSGFTKEGRGTLILGILLLFLGLLFLLGAMGVLNIQITQWFQWRNIWPVVLVVLGVFLIIDHLRRQKAEKSID